MNGSRTTDSRSQVAEPRRPTGPMGAQQLLERPSSGPPLARYLPQVLVATFLVAVCPLLVVWALEAAGAFHSALVSIPLGIALSLGAAYVGGAFWRSRDGSGDLLFGELMLWGWLRRVWLERKLANAVNLLDGLDANGELSTDRRKDLLTRMVTALEGRDPYTHGHSRRVARYAAMIAKRMGLPRADVAKVRTAAALHDAGKVATPKAILHKPERLTDAEFEVIKLHPVDGAAMVSALGDAELTAMVLHHHERLDGTGYPSRLAGNDIPLGARIISVADTFDAITSSRPYRLASPHKKAIDVLAREAGSQLDPAAVRAFGRYYSGRRPLRLWAAFSNLPEQLPSWLSGGANAVGTASLARVMAASALASAVGAAAVSAPLIGHSSPSPHSAEVAALTAGTPRRGAQNAASNPAYGGTFTSSSPGSGGGAAGGGPRAGGGSSAPGTGSGGGAPSDKNSSAPGNAAAGGGSGSSGGFGSSPSGGNADSGSSGSGGGSGGDTNGGAPSASVNPDGGGSGGHSGSPGSSPAGGASGPAPGSSGGQGPQSGAGSGVGDGSGGSPSSGAGNGSSSGGGSSQGGSGQQGGSPGGTDSGDGGSAQQGSGSGDGGSSGNGPGQQSGSGSSGNGGGSGNGGSPPLAQQSIIFTSSPVAPVLFGSTYTPAATGGASGNPVVFSIDPSSGADVCFFGSGQVSFAAGGNCVLDANQAGNSEYEAAAQQQQTVTVGYTQAITAHVGALTVASGQSVLVGPGALIGGSATVQAGGALDVEGGTITGPVNSNGATAIRICNSRITGPTTITGTTGLVVVGDNDAGASCLGNTITGPAQVTGGSGGVVFDDNTVTGALTITGNTGTLPPPHTGTVEAVGNAAGSSDIQP